jgi:hypothetical protein
MVLPLWRECFLINTVVPAILGQAPAGAVAVPAFRWGQRSPPSAKETFAAQSHAPSQSEPSRPHRMERQGLTHRDLGAVLGSRAKVTEILYRERDLSVGMTRRLHGRLRISAEALTRPVRKNAAQRKHRTSRALFEQLAPDQHAADFARAGADLIELRVAQQASERVVVGVAVSA